MMQTHWNQQAVEERVDTCADRAHFLNVFTEVNQSVKD